MTAQAQDAFHTPEVWHIEDFTLAAGERAYAGSQLVYDTVTNTALVAASSGLANYFYLGEAHRGVDATLVAKTVSVKMARTLDLVWLKNATAGDAVASTDVLKTVHLLDDQTVTVTAAGHTPIGRVLKVDATKGVLVARFAPGEGPSLTAPATGAFATNDLAPTTIVDGAVYDVPTTGAASTVTLPAAAPDGTVAYFAADGAKNTHTVQYRDETGPTNLTTALTASKRHLVVVAKRDGKWVANAYVSP